MKPSFKHLRFAATFAFAALCLPSLLFGQSNPRVATPNSAHYAEMMARGTVVMHYGSPKAFQYANQLKDRMTKSGGMDSSGFYPPEAHQLDTQVVYFESQHKLFLKHGIKRLQTKKPYKSDSNTMGWKEGHG